MPDNWKIAEIPSAGTLETVSIKDGVQILRFTPNPGFKGKFLLTAEVYDGSGKRSDKTIILDTERGGSTSPAPGTRTASQAAALQPCPD